MATNLALWRKIRARILRGEPLCRACALVERLTPATCVDHIDNDPFNIGDDNLQPLCKPCHSRKTMRDLSSQRRDPFAVKPQKKANALPNQYIF